MKKPYNTPELIVHGDVATHTQMDGYCANKDIPKGQPHSAYPKVTPSGIIVAPGVN